MPDPRTQVDRLRERITEGEREIESEADRERLLEFSDRLDLLREEYGDHRHLKLLRHCTRIAEHVGGLNAALTDREATEDIVRWIHSQYENEETNRDYRVALRVFARRVTEGDEVPDSVAWVSSKTSRTYDPSPDPAEMLDVDEDVKPMIEAARNPRDAALVGLQFDAGLRGGELFGLTVGDISDSEHGLRVRVENGKTGSRSVHLAADFSIPHLQRWLNQHPAPEDSGARLWSKLNTPEPLSRQRFYQCLQECADRAGVEKEVTPTNFRKSNATWLARRGANAALIEDRQGRERGSKAVARYVASFGEDAEAQYAKLHGKEVETSEPENRTPKECPRCTRETPRDEAKCMWCGQVLDYEAAEDIRAEQQDLRKATLRLAKQNPELLDEIEQARDLQTVFESNPELYDEAREFLEALADG
jgi:site-specific recombinase XerD/ribosomal protein L37AE/L43A